MVFPPKARPDTESDILQRVPKTQTFRVTKGFHHCHPNSGYGAIYIEHSNCIEPYSSSSGCISFESLDAAKKSLKILLKQLQCLENQRTHKFIITADCKLYLSDDICTR